MYQLALIAVAVADTLWEGAFKGSQLPGPRDYQQYNYFSAHVADPILIGHEVVEAMPIPDHWLFRVPKGLEKRAINDLMMNGFRIYPQQESRIQKRAPVGNEVEAPSLADTCAPVQLSKRAQENIKAVREEFNIADPLFGNQWHIYNSEAPGHDMNILGAWRLGARGKDVTVAILDDGLDYTHPDFQKSFSKEGSYDYNAHRNMPTPELADDWHGTRCAGEIAADFNDACGVGVAPDAKVAGVRILSGMLTTNDEARALNHYIQHNDIFSCSWGPSDDGTHMEGPPLIAKRAILNGIENGRAGLGSIYVQASGNGHHNGDNCNYDGYTNSIYSVTVASVDVNNEHPFYAESCSANLVTTYSSNRDVKITSSDPLSMHKNADASSSCTNSHTGTSASAPMAAGIFALVLGERPDLSWRDIQHVAREAAIPFEIKDIGDRGNWTETHDGKLYHNDYGYGILDAESAVKVAREWVPVGPQTWYFSPDKQEDKPIGDLFTTSIEVTETDLKNSNWKRLEHVNIRLSYEYQKRGALRFTLISPSGHEVVLSEPRSRDHTALAVHDWTFSSVANWGEDAVGTWTLKLENGVENVPMNGNFTKWSLRLWGEAEDPTLVKKYSDMWNEENPSISDEQKQALEEAPTSTAHPTTPAAKQTGTATGTSTDNLPSETNPADPDAMQQPDKFPEQPHGLVFYLACSLVGVALITAASVPIVIWAIRRRENQIPYDSSNLGLLDDDMELDDADFDDGHDSFEISDDDEPVRPEPQSLENSRIESDS